jgi:hypothetical protein
MGIGFGHAIYPTEFDIVIGDVYLVPAHVGHRRRLAILDLSSCLTNRASDHILLIVEFILFRRQRCLRLFDTAFSPAFHRFAGAEHECHLDVRKSEFLPGQWSMGGAFWEKDAGRCVEGDRLAPDIKLDFTSKVLRGFRIAPPVQDDLVVIMNMLVNMGVWFRDIEYPTEFNVIIGFRHLLAAHVSHRRALAVFNPRSRFPKRLPHHVLFIIDFLFFHLLSFLDLTLYPRPPIEGRGREGPRFMGLIFESLGLRFHLFIEIPFRIDLFIKNCLLFVNKNRVEIYTIF